MEIEQRRTYSYSYYFFVGYGATKAIIPNGGRTLQVVSFDYVYDFDRGRIVSYRDCGLPFKEIGQRVDETKQLGFGFVVAGGRKKQRIDGADQPHFVAPLPIMTGGFQLSAYSRSAIDQPQQSLIDIPKPFEENPRSQNHAYLQRSNHQ
ncbi:hypothetical protein TNCV_3371601 [Trichonephila clavipes]|nr:hypothetical protein TNCV_3371601 [Trichonephila clavipes]